MRKVYFDLGVSAICITCHPQPTRIQPRIPASQRRKEAGPLSVSININAPCDNFFPKSLIPFGSDEAQSVSRMNILLFYAPRYK